MRIKTHKDDINEKWRELMEYLYFVLRLEDVRLLYGIDERFIKEWCESYGNKICDVVLGLACGADPEKTLKLLEEGESDGDKTIREDN